LTRNALSPRAALVGVGILMLASASIRTYLGRKIAAPQLLCDEFIYAGVAKNLALHGHYLLRHETNTISFLYPALIAPAWWANSMETTYGLAKAINASVMTLAALPFYFWARRLSAPPYALGATALFLLLPAFNYTGMLMTENAFLPAFVAATYAIARTLERPRVFGQLLAVAAILIALGVRAQAAALVLVLPSALLLNVLLDRTPHGRSAPARLVRALRESWVALGALAGLGLAYGGIWLIRDSGGGTLAYQDVFGADYSLLDGVRTAVYNLAGLTLEIGVVPMSAFILVVGLALRRNPPASAADRAFAAVGVATIFWLLIEIGFFSSLFASFPVERYSFYLDSLLLLALASWLHKGLPRPRALTAVAAIAPAALVLWFPLSRFIRDSPLYSSFGLFYFFDLVARLGGSVGRVELVASVGAVLAASSFALAPRRVALFALPALLAVFFLATSRAAFDSLRTYAYFSRYATGLGSDSSWIERELGRDRPVTFLYSESGSDQYGATRVLLQAEFWNRNVQWVTNSGKSEVCPLPEKDARIDLATGRIRPTRDEGLLATPTVVTNQTVKLAGRVLRNHIPLVAYRIRAPLRLAGAYEGLYADGWTGSDAAYSGYIAPSRESSVSVGVSRASWTGTDVPSHVLLRVGTLASGSAGRPRLGRVIARRTWIIHGGASRVFVFPPPRGPYRVELHVDPTFVPADYGYADSRPLGALFNVRVVPRAPS
jgi:hypothetical protein